MRIIVYCCDKPTTRVSRAWLPFFAAHPQAKSIRTALEGEFYFYGAVLGFPATMSEDLPKIPIDNLPQPSQLSQPSQ